jgi:transcriptional regulator with XRE-family HTH domain
LKNRITEIRRAKGLSLADVAAAVGTTKSQIKKLENGDRRLTLDWMHRISKALGVSLTDLIPSSALKRGNNRVDDNISSLVALLSDADKETMLNLAKVLFEKTR